MSIINVKNVKTIFDDRVVHDGLNLTINEGEIYGLLGPSGCGKTTLMREMVMLHKYNAGNIDILGHDLNTIITVQLKNSDVNGEYSFKRGLFFHL